MLSQPRLRPLEFHPRTTWEHQLRAPVLPTLVAGAALCGCTFRIVPSALFFEGPSLFNLGEFVSDQDIHIGSQHHPTGDSLSTQKQRCLHSEKNHAACHQKGDQSKCPALTALTTGQTDIMSVLKPPLWRYVPKTRNQNNDREAINSLSDSSTKLCACPPHNHPRVAVPGYRRLNRADK